MHLLMAAPNLRRLLLYPTELMKHISFLFYYISFKKSIFHFHYFYVILFHVTIYVLEIIFSIVVVS